MDLLLEKAGVQGYLTTDDLMEVFPDASRDAERLSVILLALRRRGVDVVDPEGELETESASEETFLEDEGLITDTVSSDDTIGMYLKEMSRVPLLKMEEELSIAIRIEQGRLAKKELIKQGRKPATRRRELETLIQDGLAAREHLIKANTRLVVSIAKRYMGRGVHFLDLIQEGNLGLMKAVEKYDYHRGFRFST
jgi:RNA polymerase primary sigma factor